MTRRELRYAAMDWQMSGMWLVFFTAKWLLPIVVVATVIAVGLAVFAGVPLDTSRPFVKPLAFVVAGLLVAGAIITALGVEVQERLQPRRVMPSRRANRPRL